MSVSLEDYDTIARPFGRGQLVTVAGIAGRVVDTALRSREVRVRFHNTGTTEWYQYHEVKITAGRRVMTDTLRYSTKGLRKGPYQYRLIGGHAITVFAAAQARVALGLDEGND